MKVFISADMEGITSTIRWINVMQKKNFTQYIQNK